MLRAGLSVARVLPTLVLAVVERRERQHVEEQQRGSHGDGDAELCGIIPRVLHHQRPRLVFVPRILILAVVGRRHGRPLGVRWPGGFPVGSLGGNGVLGGLRWGHFGGGGGIVEHIMKVIEMGHEVFPEGHFGGAIVVAHSWLQPDVKVQLVLGVVLGPGNLFKTVGLCVNELGVLGNRFVWITIERGNTNGMLLNESLTTSSIIHTLTCKCCLESQTNNRQETVTA